MAALRSGVETIRGILGRSTRCGATLLCVLACCGPALAQTGSEVASESDGGEPAPEPRVSRLQDALGNGADWDIAMPDFAASDRFEATVRAGRALESTAYQELDGELRRIEARLAADPDSADALADRDALRQRLRERAETNLRLGYFYAAGVYIEMLEMTDAEPVLIRDLTRQVQVRRAFERAAEGFDAAIAGSRFDAPPGDNARFWLERMRILQAGDPDSGDSERVRSAEERLAAEVDEERSGGGFR